MRVLAFDPGFERLGIAVVEKQGGKETLLHSECLRTSPKLSFPERLRQVGDAAEAAVAKWKPQKVALENVYFEKNAKTAMAVAQVRGVLCFVAAHNGIAVCDYTPMQVKIAVTGYGKSDKKAVEMMVGKLVGLPEKKRLDDELDAIAVGLTCLASERV